VDDDFSYLPDTIGSVLVRSAHTTGPGPDRNANLSAREIVRVRNALFIALLGVTSALLIATPADAASLMQFGKIQYDSPGTDTRSVSSLNAEYVVIRNTGTTTRTLTGWTVRDAQAHVYTFGSFALGAGKSVYLHTGRGTNSAGHRYWGMGNYVWNNTGDTATIKNASGVTADVCSWAGAGLGYKNC
jgi:hypothetical protein